MLQIMTPICKENTGFPYKLHSNLIHKAYVIACKISKVVPLRISSEFWAPHIKQASGF